MEISDLLHGKERALLKGVGGVPALYQWALNFFYGANSQNLVLGII